MCMCMHVVAASGAWGAASDASVAVSGAYGLQVRSEFHDATVITIAHRLNSVLDADTIMVLDEGQLVELGTPKELMARSGGRFRSLVNAEHS